MLKHFEPVSWVRTLKAFPLLLFATRGERTHKIALTLKSRLLRNVLPFQQQLGCIHVKYDGLWQGKQPLRCNSRIVSLQTAVSSSQVSVCLHMQADALRNLTGTPS